MDLERIAPGRFALVREYAGGEGWTGVVRERGGGPELLLKVLPPGVELVEASLLASLHHPRIPRVRESGRTADGRAWMLREHLAGTPLAVPLASADEVVALGAQLLDVLAYVHLRGILHHDLKPANVLRLAGAGPGEPAPRFALLDFGLGARGGDAAGGTPFYAAPERRAGLPADRRSDLFSLGALLFVALRGPFARPFPFQDFFAAAGCEPRSLPPPFDHVLPRLLALQPEHRYFDAQEALEALTGAGGHPSLAVLRPDRIADCGDAVLAWARALPEGHDLWLEGGDDDERRALALHAASAITGVRGFQYTSERVRLLRGGQAAAAFQVPPLPTARLAAHLRASLGLEREAAERAAAALSASGVSLTELVAQGRIVPDGSRWFWPEAAAGRIQLAPAPLVPATPASLHDAAARGLGRAALASYHAAARTLSPAHDHELREALVAGLRLAGEPARALALCDSPLQRVRCLLDLGRVREAEDAAARLDHDSSVAAERLRAALDYALGRLERAEQRSRSLPGDAEDQVLLGMVLLGRGQAEAAAEVLREVVASLPRERLPHLRAVALSNLGLAEQRRPNLEPARACLEEALALFRATGSMRHVAMALLNLGLVLKDLGRHHEARAAQRQARALSHHLHFGLLEAVAEGNLGSLALNTGDPSEARRRLEAARVRIAQLGGDQLLPRIDELLAEAQARIDETTGATPGATVPPMAEASPSEVVSPEAFRTFLAVNRRLAVEADLDRALTYLLEAAITLSGGRGGYLLLERKDGLRLECRAGESGAISAFSRSLVNRAMQERRALTGDDALADRELLEMPSVRAMQKGSALCVPFVAASGAEGALYVEHPGRPGAFGPGERRQLEVLADQAAIAVDRMLREERLQQDLEHSQRDLQVARRQLRREDAPLLGRSRAIEQLRAQIQKLAAADLPLLIRGETGSGKELVARAVHAHSARRRGPFIAESCAAIAPDLIESELFGHVQGSFTGADADKPGLFELARGGTLFLDEIGEMPIELQSRLLRALQEGAIRRVGGRELIPVDFRLVSATHQDPKAMIAAGRFREDLYYRIAAAELLVPPLRDREGDVELLAQEFLARHNRTHRRNVRLGAEGVARLRAHRWPGNVRELEHAIARAFILTEGDELALEPFARAPETAATGAAPAATTDGPAPWPAITLRESERRTIDAALRATGGDKTAAAKLLGISRTALYEKLKRAT